MSKIKNGGLDRYGAGAFEQQQFGTAGVEGVNKLIIQPLYLKLNVGVRQLDLIGAVSDICRGLVGHSVNPLKCSGIRWLYLKLFSAIHV